MIQRGLQFRASWERDMIGANRNTSLGESRMAAKFLLWLGAFALIASPAMAWDIPSDNGTMGKAAIDEILAGNDYPETGTYKQAVDFIDFTANGQSFTQVVVTLTPTGHACAMGKNSSW